MEENKDYEEIQLSNVWIKIHVLDLIEEINQLQTIAKIGCLDLISLSEIEGIEKAKMRLNALDLFETRLEILKANVFFKIDPKKKLRILLMLKQAKQIKEICDYKEGDRLNCESCDLNENFFIKLDVLQKIKEDLIEAIAEKGLLLPTTDDDLEKRTNNPDRIDKEGK